MISFYAFSFEIPLPLSREDKILAGHSLLDKLCLLRISPSTHATVMNFEPLITNSGTSCTPLPIHFHPIPSTASSGEYTCKE